MKVLVTGAAGFIGFHTCLKLIENGHEVFGIDNINNYYDVTLKYSRLKMLGFNQTKFLKFDSTCISSKYKKLRFSRIDITSEKSISILFKNKFDVVCNLAAQAGVRYSLENPRTYIDSNIVGFLNILEGCRNFEVKHLVYASSSSIYGENKKVPFEISDNVNNPISLYAATKKSNELMAHTYGHLYGFKTTGLRFFTVYGPWGRPDMAYFLFTNAIVNNKLLKVFNNGIMERDFTYIDDIVEGMIKVIEKNISNREHYKLYNIGNNKTVKLNDFIITLENLLNKRANKKMYPMQPGDVPKTWADINDIMKDYNYSPKTNLENGLASFVNWFQNYYDIN